MGQRAAPDEGRRCAEPCGWQPGVCALASLLALLALSVLSTCLDVSTTEEVHLREPHLGEQHPREPYPPEPRPREPPLQEPGLRGAPLREPELREPPSKRPAGQKSRVAYVVFVNESGSRAWQDALEVLVLGLSQACQRSAYEADVLALAPERLGPDAAQQLLRLGFHGVVRRPIPISTVEAAGPEAGEPSGQGPPDGAMGLPEETIKYWVLTLAKYHRVLVLDADAIIFDPADELFEAEASFITAPRAGPTSRGLPPLGGGFLLVRPSEADFQAVKDALAAGRRAGPAGTGPGGRLEASRFASADARVYGATLADGPLGELRDPAALSAAAARVKAARFGGACGRPWLCEAAPPHPVCRAWVDRWWQLREELGRRRGAPGASPQQCEGGRYEALPPAPPAQTLPGAAARPAALGRLRVAFAVFITDVANPQWQDGLAVLAFSVLRAANASRHQVELVVLAPERFSAREEQVLRQSGYSEVIRRPIPVPVEEVQGKVAREALGKMSAGTSKFQFAEETIKYWGMALTQYDRVLIIDADFLVIDAMDELMEDEADLVGVYDHAMDCCRSALPPVQGGFLLVRPGEPDFQAIKDLMREGDWKLGPGWKGSNIGYWYGGVGPDGLLQYYYNQGALPHEFMTANRTGHGPLPEGLRTARLRGSRAHFVDRSVYDVLVTKRLIDELDPADHGAVLAGVKSIHFTGSCPKPWGCARQNHWLCGALADRWWKLRAELGGLRGASNADVRCPGGRYEALSTTAPRGLLP